MWWHTHRNQISSFGETLKGCEGREELIKENTFALETVDCVWNVMAHAQKPDFVFRRNGRVHLNRLGRQFSRLLAAEVCASTVVMLDTQCSEVVWRVLATHSIRKFPLHFPPVRHRVPSHFKWSLPAHAVKIHHQRTVYGLCNEMQRRRWIFKQVLEDKHYTKKRFIICMGPLPHGATDPSEPGPSHCRDLTITLSDTPHSVGLSPGRVMSLAQRPLPENR